ncbi:NAD(P)-dependent oxidoreductase [Geomonas sp.]|uniref:NAD(P)-dependent oxidoreductase n=1 Tax=Geomonas sp. TaxID=2651584 RepID=UPI002B4A2DE6|nr:NAD(P)-dependent oxidoreductase [Geomonas sp.]HJV36428.1 NAD(P)-dependent oxidoreductase [Geomonas sp.]
MKVTLIGLGRMGSAMAPNLIKAGHSLTVFNRTRSRSEPFAKMGAAVAETVGAATSGAEVVITLLADDQAVESVVFSADGILQQLPRDAIHVSMSTISVALSRRLAEAHDERGQQYLAVPVFGRPEAAAAAKLFVVAGGPAPAIARCLPLFEAIGQKTLMVGEDAPSANVVKLTGNFLITTVIEGLAESVALARKQGVDPRVLMEVLTGSLFSAPVYQTYGRMIATDNFEPVGFRMPLGLKDNRLLMAAAEEAAVPMPMASLIHDRFLSAIAQGMEEADWSAIARLSLRNAGL